MAVIAGVDGRSSTPRLSIQAPLLWNTGYLLRGHDYPFNTVAQFIEAQRFAAQRERDHHDPFAADAVENLPGSASSAWEPASFRSIRRQEQDLV
jgi:hypothetical protein